MTTKSPNHKYTSWTLCSDLETHSNQCEMNLEISIKNSIVFYFDLDAYHLYQEKKRSELFTGPNLRTKLDLWRSSALDKMKLINPQYQHKKIWTKGIEFKVDTSLPSTPWYFCTVFEKLGRLHYLVELHQGYTIKHHID